MNGYQKGVKMQTKIKFRRKNGIGFITPLYKKHDHEVVIVHNHKEYTIDTYFNNVISSYKIRMHLLNNLVKQLKHTIRIKILGSGICSQIRTVEGCIAKTLLHLLSDEKITPENKEIIISQYDLLKTLSKNDLRIVERKKSGFKKARKQKPHNKR